MSLVIDALHVVAEIALVLIIVRLQYELFCVRRAMQKMRWFLEDFTRHGSVIVASESSTSKGGETTIDDKAKE